MLCRHLQEMKITQMTIQLLPLKHNWIEQLVQPLSHVKYFKSLCTVLCYFAQHRVSDISVS